MSDVGRRGVYSHLAKNNVNSIFDCRERGELRPNQIPNEHHRLFASGSAEISVETFNPVSAFDLDNVSTPLQIDVNFLFEFFGNDFSVWTRTESTI